MQRLLVTLGVVFLICGLAWPWLMRLGLGRLPGDIRIERDGFGFYLPITTSVVVSLLLTLLFWLLRK
jgi:ribose/xylose/arabinose/galactoside ABC-type transport system permease subunit